MIPSTPEATTSRKLACATAAGAKPTPLGDGRYSLDVPVEVAPERLLSALVEAGAQPVSLSPVQETLEDFFVRQVGSAPTDRGLARE